MTVHVYENGKSNETEFPNESRVKEAQPREVRCQCVQSIRGNVQEVVSFL